MQVARLSFTQYIKINRYLKHYNGGFDLLPGYAVIKQVKNEHAVQKQFGEYEYWMHLEGSVPPSQNKIIKLPFWWICPCEALRSHMRTLRDSYGGTEHISIGTQPLLHNASTLTETN